MVDQRVNEIQLKQSSELVANVAWEILVCKEGLTLILNDRIQKSILNKADTFAMFEIASVLHLATKNDHSRLCKLLSDLE